MPRRRAGRPVGKPRPRVDEVDYHRIGTDKFLLVEMAALDPEQARDHQCDVCRKPIRWRFGHTAEYDCRNCAEPQAQVHWYCDQHAPADLVRVAITEDPTELLPPGTVIVDATEDITFRIEPEEGAGPPE